MSLLCRSGLRFCAAVLIVTAAVRLQGEDRKYVVGTTVDIVGGGSNGQNGAGSVTDGSNRLGSFFL